jgi:hypothetical protein
VVPADGPGAKAPGRRIGVGPQVHEPPSCDHGHDRELPETEGESERETAAEWCVHETGGETRQQDVQQEPADGE